MFAPGRIRTWSSPPEGSIIPLMGCVSTLPQSADSAARTNVSEHTRAGRPPPDDAAGETTNREEKDDEAHVHTDRANARPIRSGAHSREPSHGSAAQRGVWGAHIFRQQRWTYYPGTDRERFNRGAVGQGREPRGVE